MRNFILTTIVMLLATATLSANNNVIVTNYTTENGLPHNTVFRSLKDADGFMWFGTWYGLSCFDGSKFRSFSNRDDFNADIPPHKIQNIVEANDNNLWVKTIDHKLYLFDKNSELYYEVFNEIKKKYQVSPKIIKIQQNENGNLLLLTKNKDLLEAKSLGNGEMEVDLLFNSQKRRNNNSSGNIFSEDKNSLNWIGVDFTIISCKKGAAFQSKPSDFTLRKIGNIQGQQLSCAYKWGNNFYLGDNFGNIFKINFEKGTLIKYPYFNGSGTIQNISKANEKGIYVSIAGKGVFEFNESKQTANRIIPLSPNENITNTFTDSYDKSWFFVGQSTAIYYDPLNATSKRFALSTGNANRTIRWQDGKEMGFLILSTGGEVVWFDRESETISTLNQIPELNLMGEKKFFFDMQIDKDNILWLSSTINGIFRISFPKQQFKLYKPEGLDAKNQSIKSVYQARNGDIWVGSRTGDVFLMNKDGVVKKIFGSKNYRIGNVYHMMEDNKGNIWFSTKGNGLVRAEYNPKSPLGFDFKRFVYDASNPFSISSNDVYYTYEDSKNRIWVALFGGGLNLIQQKADEVIFKSKFNSFKNYPKYGLYMEVRNIAEDKDGRMWVGTSDGLLSFDNHFDNAENIDFEIYRNENARSNVSDNDIYVLYKDADGHLWVSVFGGGLNKLERYDLKKRRPIFKEFSSKEGLKSDVILSIAEDNNNCLWLATENGISRFDKTNETFRNFNRYDGFLNIQMEEESAAFLNNGLLWFGSQKGILTFNPAKIETYKCDYKTFIVDFRVSSRDLRSFIDDPILKSSIRYAKEITLKHNQSNFVIEFAALNYYNQNRVSYKYILEGYEEEWHINGKNRIASYPNVPHGKYKFRVQAIDEANTTLKSEAVLEIIVLPPWWLSWWAKIFYFLLILVLIYLSVRAVLFFMRIRNEMYVEQRVSELKIRFFTNISHELRTPLTLIMGPIQELRQKQQLNEKGIQYVTMIEKYANQMLQLVNQILDFRKIQNGKMVLHVSKLSLNSLLESLHNEFSVLSEENDIRFTYKSPGEDIYLWADKEKLETVIRNILSNAFKFTKPGGKITISAGLNQDGEKCYFSIEDTGVGIPANKLTEIFERFFQAENHKNVQSPGTGIGLALSKEIVNMHHGEITADSKQGQGTIFKVELQVNKEHFNPSEVNFYVSDSASESVKESNNAELMSDNEIAENDNKKDLPTLLVVEDNKDLCTLLRMQLDDRYRVFTAGNGVEGLKKVKQHHPDIVVTDQMMPEMTGTEMMIEMRNDFNISHIPVIILTAKTDDDAKLKAISLGANAYITKPFNKDYLVARIEQLLGDRKVFREKVWKQENATVEVPINETYENYLQKKDIDFLDKIHKIIEENIDNSEFNIDSIADSIGISRSAFFKKLKSLTGLAPVDTIKDVRLTKSIELLKNTDLTISEVAYAVGFKEAGYYGKCFRKKYGQTPTEYMNKYRKA